MSERETLERVERLLALNLVDGKERDRAIKLLYRADYTSAEIGEFLGMNSSTVRGRVRNLKDEGEIND